MYVKSLKSFVISYILGTFAPDNEPFLRLFWNKRAKLERKQADGSALSGLIMRISRKNVEIRRFPVRRSALPLRLSKNLENRVISQTYDKQRKFEFFYKDNEKIWERRKIHTYKFPFLSILPPSLWRLVYVSRCRGASLGRLEVPSGGAVDDEWRLAEHLCCALSGLLRCGASLLRGGVVEPCVTMYRALWRTIQRYKMKGLFARKNANFFRPF